MSNILEEQNSSKIFRVIDANLNRAREGLRVVEDIHRYLHDNKKVGYKLKELRHSIRVENFKELLQFRDSTNDCLKSSTQSELQKENIEQIIISNIKRVQESLRVLEEIYKTIDTEKSEYFKQLRYTSYTLEKDIFLS
ncbi:MAG: thiamine-phosphate pyrophosphorylase [Campylobacterales bacterium]|nr:thiamine-phosphate pyrophosphorylase [Campylobacterales bacterium]